MPTREEAWNLLCEWTEGDSLRKHARAVEHAMRTYARKYGEDEEKWGVVGMLHDFDYERYPDQRHPQLGSEVLRERGYPEDVIRAILSHADYTGVKRESLMEHAIFATDELCGFLTACALVRPTRASTRSKSPRSGSASRTKPSPARSIAPTCGAAPKNWG